jgi:hypothetical protein
MPSAIQEERRQEKPTLLRPWPWTTSFRTYEEANIYFSYPGYGTLLWQSTHVLSTWPALALVQDFPVGKHTAGFLFQAPSLGAVPEPMERNAVGSVAIYAPGLVFLSG